MRLVKCLRAERGRDLGEGMNITVSGYNRPDYLRRTLSALSRCDGIGTCRVVVLLDPCDETDEQAALAGKFGFEVLRHQQRLGCNRAIGVAFSHGFSELGSEFHVHFEDDTVPCRDALRWFRWARDAYRDNPAVLNVSGYQRVSNGRLAECGLRKWFTPWGWGTWRDRWAGLARGWTWDDTSWDVVVNHSLRAGRYEVFPTVSRIQNIGAERGTHVPSAEWHAANHHVSITADDLTTSASFPVFSWQHTRTDDHADHA